MYRHILVPLDGSELAEVALPHAIAVAKPSNARVTLLQVVPSTTARTGLGEAGVFLDAEFWRKLDESRVAEARAYLERVAERLTADGLQVDIVLRKGEPADTVIDVAKELEADLIVMATHGRTGLGRWVLGSVADRVVRASHLPVLLIRPADVPSDS